MRHILEAMVRWIAPILSFTAEEIWALLPADNHSNTIFKETYYKGLFALDESTGARRFWSLIMQLRDPVSKAIEELRSAGEVGSSLATEVVIYTEGELLTDCEKLGEELRFVLITSSALVKPLSEKPENVPVVEVDGIKIAVSVTASEQDKCVRCWHYREDVGSVVEHPEICTRCHQNLFSGGEQRLFA